MKRIITTLFLCLPLLTIARDLLVPDNDSIFYRINDKTSAVYYPVLMSRYMAGERTLTTEEYHYLYYGYAFQADYSPLDPLPGMDEMLSVLERSMEPDSLGCATIIANGKKVLEKDPFNPSALNLMAYAYTILGDTVSARTNAIKVEKILRTIKDSGTGLSERSPWAVLAFSHANDVVASLGLPITNRRVVSRSVEYIDIGRREGKIKGFFIDYSRVYWNKPENIPEREREGVSLNGILLE